ncbi:MAG: polysaccharide deacetylase family protein [Lewinella sp.]
MPLQTVITVLSSHRHPRLRYTLKALEGQLGFRFRLMTNPQKWEEIETLAKITLMPINGQEAVLQWPLHHFLSGGSPSSSDLEVTWKKGELPFFFPTTAVGSFSHDLLSMMFFCLSRYEEYGEFNSDEHKRFPASESHALKNGYLQLPVVNLWAKELERSLREKFPDLPSPKQTAFQFIPTYDIDILWAWQHRGLVRSIGGGARDFLHGHFLRAWKRYVTPKAQDPHQTLNFLEDLHRQHSLLSPIYFWLLADNSDRRDPNPYPTPPEQQQLIKQFATKYVVGIHPSYHSSDQPELMPIETKRLADITGKAVRHSRQHFLRFRLPETYRQLNLAGITHEYSMGYADAVGWRAGTNFAYFWYDLEREQSTSLLIHPFAAMDVTLKNYLHLGPEEAKKSIVQLAEGLREFGGPFLLLWHNTSFSEIYGWEGWQEMYSGLVEELARD